MPASMATISAILKEVYEGDVRDQLNDDVIATKRIASSSEGVSSQVGGKYVTFPIRTRRNAGLGARAEMEALPTAGQQGTAAARVGLSYLYGSIQLSGQSIELADSDFQAFTSALDLEVDGLKTDLAKDYNRQVYGDGTGRIATATTANAANLFVTTNTQYVQLGEQVDIIDGTTLGNPTPTAKASNRQVTAISNNTNVTFSGAAVSSAIGDILVRTGNANREITGFASIAGSTAPLFNIDPAVEPVWQPVINHNSGTLRALSEGLMIQTVDTVRANGGETTVGFCNLGVRRSYFNLLVQQRQFSNTKEFAGGFSGLAFVTDRGEIPIVVDVDCPPNLIYFLNEKQLKVYQESDWSWMDRDGSKWTRVVSGGNNYDAYQAMMYKYCQMGTHRRNSQAVLKDITES